MRHWPRFSFPRINTTTGGGPQHQPQPKQKRLALASSALNAARTLAVRSINLTATPSLSSRVAVAQAHSGRMRLVQSGEEFRHKVPKYPTAGERAWPPGPSPIATQLQWRSNRPTAIDPWLRDLTQGPPIRDLSLVPQLVAIHQLLDCACFPSPRLLSPCITLSSITCPR